MLNELQCGKEITFSDFSVNRKSSNPLKFGSRDSRYSLTEFNSVLKEILMYEKVHSVSSFIT